MQYYHFEMTAQMIQLPTSWMVSWRRYLPICKQLKISGLFPVLLVEQYRNQTKPTIPEIAKKLGVNYIVEGSGQKYGNKFRLRVQLIRAAKESHLWAKSYEQEINEAKDIFQYTKPDCTSNSSTIRSSNNTYRKNSLLRNHTLQTWKHMMLI